MVYIPMTITHVPKKLTTYCILWLLVILSVPYNVVIASSASNDCVNLLSGLEPSAQASKAINDLWLKFFKQEDLTTAYTFAINGCCDEQPGLEQCSTKKYTTKYHPGSNYLFDHLMYVGMSKLDGVQETCDTLQITCHPKATERRSTIVEIAEQRDGVPPSRIIWEFFKYRGSGQNSIFEPLDTKNEENTEIKSNSEFLWSEYQRMCNEAVNIISNRSLSQSSDPLKGYNDVSPRQWCQNIVTNRFLKEIEYIKTLQVEKGLKFANDHIKNYITTYLYQNRWMTMLDTLQELNSGLTHVLSLIQRTTNCCSK